jgi:tryptophan 2,3-dioxygenase
MPKPAVWNDEPECGHEVASAYQTHYCTYVRVPRLLSLQHPHSPDELLLITAYQWYELWFKVLLTDLRAALADASQTYEPIKLLRRGVELLKLFDAHADFAETIVVRELGLARPVRMAEEKRAVFSGQFAELEKLARPLLRALGLPGAGNTVAARFKPIPILHTSPMPEAAAVVREYAARLKAFQSRYRKFVKTTLAPKKTRAPSFAEWLHLPDLLSLQDGLKAAWAERGREPSGFWKPERIDPDEMMFIVVHQCFEIWFKVVLDHVDRAIPLVLRGEIAEAARLLRRAVHIQRLLVQQIQIPATMLPLDFMRFRSQKLERDGQTLYTGLSPASGTESYQFREIEIVCGLRDDPVFQKYLAGTDKLPIRLLTPRQRERLQQTTLPEAFRRAVRARGLPNFDSLFTPASVPNPHTDLAGLADTLIEFDEFFRFWRLGHVSMVEKMIGAKSGTGFLGPEYLMETAGIKIQEQNRVFAERQVRPRFFEELWAVRTRMSSY